MSLMEKLLTLHRVDAQVRGLRGRLESSQRYLKIQQTQLDTLLNEQKELHNRRQHVQATIGNQEAEVGSVDARIEKLRDELNSASTNKQYAALLTELNTFKDQRKELEDQMLQHMEDVEELEQQEGELTERITERRKVVDAAKDELQGRQAEIGDRLSELESERAVAAADVPPAELGLFDELAETYDGEAMAVVVEVDRRHREYACGACNMLMPFERFSLLLGSGDAVVRCSACHRILFVQEETRGALAKK